MDVATAMVTIEPWNPWPLAFPTIVVIASVMASVVGSRCRSRPVREAGYAGFVVGTLAVVWMTWSLSGLWDSSARETALASAGYESPTFSGGTDVMAGELTPLAWQAVRDGERVHGVLRPLGGDGWELREAGD
ncbi:hypothetical protein [Agromyces bauzanensis]|uniref:Uncharacterized protein n=1 Tax=Agromyces bauzanensis TaxID=1308924 RepID=A0A917PIN0_9MICO|nr:hypothetical protein [Agromyces bauzanensis]GGJ80709.1 hypothetical protein GCM10011372_18930 [Agromyces bauzanensis]